MSPLVDGETLLSVLGSRDARHPKIGEAKYLAATGEVIPVNPDMEDKRGTR
jgi:hypothetical protein